VVGTAIILFIYERNVILCKMGTFASTISGVISKSIAVLCHKFDAFDVSRFLILN